MKGQSEGRDSTGALWPSAITSGSLIAQHVAGKAARDTLFLTHFGISLLPAAMIGAALASSLAMVAISRALSRYSPARVVPWIFGIGAVLFLFEWWLSVHDERAATLVVYAHTAIFSASGVSAFWSFVNERFDPHVAKRYVGRIAGGGTVGGIVGGLLVWQASSYVTVPMILALLALMSGIGLAGSLRMRPPETKRRRSPPEAPPQGALSALGETPYLRDLGLLVLAGATVQALLDWLLSAQATGLYGKGARLLAFFALFNMVVGVASFLSQAGLSRPFLEKLGLGGTVKLQPLVVAVFGGLALVAPGLGTVIVLRGLEAVSRNSFFRSAYELFYTPLPKAKKRAAKTLIDVGFDRLGTFVGSGALLAVPLLPFDTTRFVLFLCVAVAVASTLAAARLQEGYVAALAASLKSGAVELDDSESLDLTTRKTLAETTALLDREKLLARIEQFQRDKDASGESTSAGGSARSVATSERLAPSSAPSLESDPLVVRALALRGSNVARIKGELAEPLQPELAPFVVPLLANDAVVREAVRALRKIAPKITGLLLDVLLDAEGDPRVRRRIPRVLKVCRTPRAASGMVLALKDETFEVRVQVALALTALVDGGVEVDRETIYEVAVFELTTGRASWTQNDLPRGLAHVFTVLGLVSEREPLSIAYRAIRSEDTALRGTAREYLDVVLPSRVRDLLVPLLGDVRPPPATGRRPKDLADELLRSHAAIPRPTPLKS